MEQPSQPLANSRWHKFNLGFLIGITLMALPIYGLLFLVLAFCDSPGGWCSDQNNLRLIALFGWWLPLAIWLCLLVGAIRKQPWRAAVWLGGALFTLMALTLLALSLLTIYETA